MDRPTKPNSFRRFVLPAALSVVLVLPALIWVLLDRGFTVGDQALYKIVSIELYATLVCQTSAWLSLCFEVLSGKAPLLWWIGQFFVPVGMAIGSVNQGLLLFPILVEILILFFAFGLFRELTGRRDLAVAGTGIIAGSRLLFVMSTQFWTEPNRLLVVILVLYVVSRAHRYDTLRFGLWLMLLFMLSLLEKSTAPIFAFAPLLYGGALWLIKLRREGLRPERGHRLLVAGTVFVTVLAVTWYVLNFNSVREWIHHATTSSNYHKSTGQTVWYRLSYWSFYIRHHLLSPLLLWASAGTVLIALLYHKRFRERPAGKMEIFLALSIGQITLALALFSRTSNPEIRYLLSLLPYFALIMVWVLYRIGKVWPAYAFLAVALFQVGHTYAAAFGITDWPERSPYFFRALEPTPPAHESLAEHLDPESYSAVYCAIHPELNSKVLRMFWFDRADRICTWFDLPDIYDVEIEIDMLNMDGILAAESDSILRRIDREEAPLYILHEDRTAMLESFKEDYGWHQILMRTEQVNLAIERDSSWQRLSVPESGIFKVYRQR